MHYIFVIYDKNARSHYPEPLRDEFLFNQNTSNYCNWAEKTASEKERIARTPGRREKIKHVTHRAVSCSLQPEVNIEGR